MSWPSAIAGIGVLFGIAACLCAMTRTPWVSVKIIHNHYSEEGDNE